MKKIILLILGFSPMIIFPQNKLSYSEIIQTDSLLSKDQLYERAREWLNDNYESYQAVVNIQDRESGELIGKGNIQYNSSIFVGSAATKGIISFTIKIYVKNGRYKYEFSNFIHEGNQYCEGGPQSFNLITIESNCPYAFDKMRIGITDKWKNKVWSDIKENIHAAMMIQILSLKAAMTKNIEKDW